MIYASTSDEQVDKFTMELNIQYRACIGELIYLLATSVYYSFSVQKLERFHKNLVKYTLKYWYIYWGIFGKIRLWY